MLQGKVATIGWELLSETLGTFTILFFGNGSGGGLRENEIHSSWEAGIIWGFAVLIGIVIAAPVSGAHLNPAVTAGMAAGGRMPLWKVPHYILGQLLGALLGAAVVYGSYFPLLALFEKENGIVRGEEGSYVSGAMFRCTLHARITPVHGFLIEWMITAFLLVVICAVGDKNATPGNKSGYGPYFGAIVIALTVAVIVAAFAPLTAGCLNPARDLSPRLITLFAGWGRSAFPGERQDPVWVYMLGPLLGGVTGVLFWNYVGSYMFKFGAKAAQRLILEDSLPEEFTGVTDDVRVAMLKAEREP